MKQAIAGVTPPTQKEVTVMTVWPSISVFALGRTLGELFSIKAGVFIFTVGNFLAGATIPVSLLLYFLRVGIRYRLTNRRVIRETGIRPEETNSVELDRFDAIDVVVRSGQAWYDAGDLVFRLGKVETFRLDGVSRPDAFRSTIMKARAGFVGVKRALEKEVASS